MHAMNFDEAARVFLIYCRAKGLAPRTLQTYSSGLRKLKAFLDTADGEPTIPSAGQLRAYIAHLLDVGLAKTSIGIHMRSIRCFYNFLEREELIAVSPMTRVEIPRVPDTFPAILSNVQIKQLLGAIKKGSWHGTRNYAILLTFLDTGVRLGELIGLDLNDIDLGNCSIRIRRGKWGKERHVFVGRGLHRALRKWLDARGVSSASPALFITRNGTRIDYRSVGRIIERIAKKADLDDVRVHPHLLRHTFATHYIMNGGDPFSLQRILGHSDIKTTMIYVNLAGVGLREAHAKASPVDRLLSRSAD